MAHVREALREWSRFQVMNETRRDPRAVLPTAAAPVLGVGSTLEAGDALAARHTESAIVGTAPPPSLPQADPASLNATPAPSLVEAPRKRARATAAATAASSSCAAAAASAVPAAAKQDSKQESVPCLECSAFRHKVHSTCMFFKWHQLGSARGADHPRSKSDGPIAASRRAWPAVRDRVMSLGIEAYAVAVAAAAATAELFPPSSALDDDDNEADIV